MSVAAISNKGGGGNENNVIKSILHLLGTSVEDWTKTNSGKVQYSNVEVNDVHVRVEIKAQYGPSGQTYVGYSKLESIETIDLTDWDCIIFDGLGYVTQAAGYSKTAYLQIWFENVDNSSDKIYLYNHAKDANLSISWEKASVNCHSANGNYKLVMYISEEDGAKIDYIDLSDIWLVKIPT